jgi:hypothetical protein
VFRPPWPRLKSVRPSRCVRARVHLPPPQTLWSYRPDLPRHLLAILPPSYRDGVLYMTEGRESIIQFPLRGPLRGLASGGAEH